MKCQLGHEIISKTITLRTKVHLNKMVIESFYHTNTQNFLSTEHLLYQSTNTCSNSNSKQLIILLKYLNYDLNFDDEYVKKIFSKGNCKFYFVRKSLQQIIMVNLSNRLRFNLHSIKTRDPDNRFDQILGMISYYGIFAQSANYKELCSNFHSVRYYRIGGKVLLERNILMY